MVTYTDASALLAKVQGCTFAALDTLTYPPLKGGKANPMQGKIAKHSIGHRVMLFTNKNSSGYENKVRRHLIAEGKNPDSFAMGALPWGKRIENTPFIENNGKYYLQTVFLKSGENKYRVTNSGPIVLPDGKVFLAGSYIDKDDIIGLKETSGSEGQGLENEVIVRAFALESILAIRAMNNELA